MQSRVSARLLKQLEAEMRGGPMHELTRTLGPWAVSNLYLGPTGYDGRSGWFIKRDALSQTIPRSFAALHAKRR